MQDTSRNEDPVASKFEYLRSRTEGALVAYLTGGDPTPELFVDNCSALVEGGADIVEIGVPFSDPIADGPVIQASSQRALRGGITPKKVLSLAGELSAQHDVPLVLLTYYNPILAVGIERFLRLAKKSGVTGVVVPDVPADGDPLFYRLAKKNGLDNILLAAPNTSQARLRRILAETAGFLYFVSLYGVTGPRKSLGPDALESLRRIGSINKDRIPVSAGFGISKPEHIRSVMRAGADGAIVGSALVQIIQDHLHDPEKAADALLKRVDELKQATKNF